MGGDNARKSCRLEMRQKYKWRKLQEALVDFLKTGNISRHLSRKERVSPQVKQGQTQEVSLSGVGHIRWDGHRCPLWPLFSWSVTEVVWVACSDCNRDSHLPGGQSVLCLCIQSQFSSWQPLFLLHCCSQKQQSASSPSPLLSTGFKLSQATPAPPPLHSCPGCPQVSTFLQPYSYSSTPSNISGRRRSRCLGRCPCLSLQGQRAAVCLPQTWVTATLGVAKGDFWADEATLVAINPPTSYSRVMGERGRTQGRLPCPAPALSPPQLFSVGCPAFPEERCFPRCPHSPLLVAAGWALAQPAPSLTPSACCLLQILGEKPKMAYTPTPWGYAGLNIPQTRLSTGREFQPGWGVPLLGWCYKLKMPVKTQAPEPREVSARKCHHRKDSTAPKEGHWAGVWTGISLVPCMTHSWKWKCNPITCALWQDGHNPSRKGSLKINLLLLLLLLFLRSQIEDSKECPVPSWQPSSEDRTFLLRIGIREKNESRFQFLR